MSTVHAKNGALYLGLTTAVPIAEATKWALTIDADKVDDSAFGDAWETRLRSALSWSGSAEGNFDTASSDLFDIAAATGLCKAYLYPDRADAAKYYYGTCWPNLTIDAIRTDAGRVSADWKGSGALGLWNLTAYEAAVLADTPYLYLRLDDAAGPTATDRSGNGRNGTYSGSGVTYRQPACVAGGYAASFNGAAGNVNVSTPLAGFNAAAFTIEFWLKPTTVTGTFYLFDAGFSPRFALSIVNGSLRWADNGNVRLLATLAAGVCQHVAVVVNSPTIQAYVNGTPDTLVNMGSGFVFGTPFASAVKFGSSWDDGAFTNGTVSDLAVYATALSGARIAAHYNAGIGA